MILRTASKLSAPLQTNISLSGYSTFKIGGPARYFSEPTTREELRELLDFRKAEHLNLFLVGRGSNLLFDDAGFNGLVISLRKLDASTISIEHEFQIRVASGLGLFQLALFCQDRELGGAEFLCHIPGTVGGAVFMNAGYGRPEDGWHEIKEILENITVMDLDGHTQVLERKDLGFGYRRSNLTNEQIVLEAVLKLYPKPREKIEHEMKANFAYRNSVQDLRYPSAGSVFKNPKPFPLSAGQLLERVGMKKVRIGGAMVSDRHANFIVNVGGAKAKDVLGLIKEGQKRVLESFNVQLDPEVRFISSGYESGSV